MLYHWYELGHAAVTPARVAADAGRIFFKNPFNPLTHTSVGRHAAAACEVFERTTRRYDRPDFGISSTHVEGREIAVEPRVVWQKPFCRLIHFARDLPVERLGTDPRILLVAPMSGHFATLLRGTVETLLPDHEVFITDWSDARDVATGAGRFDLDDYIDYVRAMLTHLGGDAHVFAVCQPSVPVLAAIALMEEDDDPCRPLSMVLAGGPIDTRVGPTVVNRLAEERGTAWFERNVITSVPWPNRGFGRLVYPGFLQLTGFMTMNLDRHMKAHKDLFFHLVRGDGDNASKHRAFYDEYLAVMDLTAEFFLQTVETVFVRHALAKGEMRHRGRPVDLGAIRRVAMLTIEGENDDITGRGQCAAAHALCTGLARARMQHYECPEVGHYGIFNGSRFRNEIAPRIARFVRRHDPQSTIVARIPSFDRAASAVRVHGWSRELEAGAFSFAPANDTQPDPMAERFRSRGLGVTAEAGRDADTSGASGATPLRWWAFATGLCIDQAVQWQRLAGLRGRSTETR